VRDVLFRQLDLSIFFALFNAEKQPSIQLCERAIAQQKFPSETQRSTLYTAKCASLGNFTPNTLTKNRQRRGKASAKKGIKHRQNQGSKISIKVHKNKAVIGSQLFFYKKREKSTTLQM